MVLALGMLVALLVYALATAGSSRPITVTAHAPVALAGGAWESVALPVPRDQLRAYAVAPADPATLFACTGSVNAALMLWRTRDTGAQWTQIALPGAGSAKVCDIAFAPDRPGRVAVLLTNGAAATATGAASGATLALSDDSGATWRAIPHTSTIPQGTIAVWSRILVSAHTLYLVTSYYPGSIVNGTGVSAGPQVTQLERSDDEGASWVRADAPFDNTLFMPWQLGDGATLLASVLRDTRPYHDNGPELWITHDGGRSWRQSGLLPRGAGTFVLVPQRGGVATGPTPSAPYYALSGEQLPIGLYRLRVFQSSDGQHWTPLPPLPVPGASPTRAGYLQALGVAPDGRLLVLGPDPRKGVPASAAENAAAPAVWLWLWDPRTTRWDVLAAPLNVPGSIGCGLCWWSQVATGADGASSLYVLNGDTLSAGPTGIFRVRVPAASGH